MKSSSEDYSSFNEAQRLKRYRYRDDVFPNYPNKRHREQASKDPVTVIVACSNSKWIEDGPIMLREFPTRPFGHKKLSFQLSWYDKYNWLEYSISQNSAHCFCCRMFGSGQTPLAGKTNWKKM